MLVRRRSAGLVVFLSLLGLVAAAPGTAQASTAPKAACSVSVDPSNGDLVAHGALGVTPHCAFPSTRSHEGATGRSVPVLYLDTSNGTLHFSPEGLGSRVCVVVPTRTSGPRSTTRFSCLYLDPVTGALQRQPFTTPR